MTQGSIRRRLSLMVLASVALVWVATLVSTFRHASQEVQRWQDTRLVEFAKLLTVLGDDDLIRLAHSHIDARIELPEPDELASGTADSDIAPREVLIDVKDAQGRTIAASPALAQLGPIAPPPAHTEGPRSATLADTVWRIETIRDAQTGRVVQVMETSNSRSDLARGAALHVSRPLLFALPALALLVWLAIGRSLAPLRTLSEKIRARDATTFEPIDIEHVPTEVRPLVDAIDQLLARLKQSIARERAFTSDAAHELKTPLAAIKVQAQVALAADDPMQRQLAIQRVVQGVDRSSRLAEQLLLLARLDEHDRIPTVPVALDALVLEAIARHAERARQKPIEISALDLPARTVLAEPFLIGILLDNLFDNSIKYGKPGGHIEAALFDDGDAVSLVIRDDGQGVAASEMRRLVDRFYRGGNAAAPGSGLGLSIVRRIVSYFNGRLTFEPGMGGAGLTVIVSLRRAGESSRPQSPAADVADSTWNSSSSCSQ
ncbi:two-component sensor histidine kinase [Trinickia dabaoshanensis]|uniref:histidine kinase n=1 Tax=Trinickia dabaoshanensis TaxID=564714 RepID=A0A2N7VBP7_9BURK|nr:ATP-binding protein [Trinickia dabaoshanensis]PMS14565.1 two-component sensor histidine kinase [Trinickia dabaoshanensis]